MVKEVKTLSSSITNIKPRIKQRLFTGDIGQLLQEERLQVLILQQGTPNRSASFTHLEAAPLLIAGESILYN